MSKATDLIGFNRKVSIDICKGGVVTYRTDNKQKLGGSLPFYSANSEDHAKSLIRLHCKLAYNNKDYFISQFAGTIEAMGELTELFYKHDRDKNLESEPLTKDGS